MITCISLATRYNPTLAEVSSFLVPRFWQVVDGETGRDLIFFGSFIVSYFIALSRLINLLINPLSQEPFN